MDKTEIMKNLITIKFDPSKHHSLKAALSDILKEETYNDIMCGNRIDVKGLEEVRKILSAYENLKEYEEEILSSDFSINKVDRTSEIFVILKDNIIQIIKKEDNETEYKCILELKNDDKIVKQVNEYIFVANKDNGVIEKIYNLHGDIILDFCDENLKLLGLSFDKTDWTNIKLEQITDILVGFYIMVDNNVDLKNKLKKDETLEIPDFIVVNLNTREYMDGSRIANILLNEHISKEDKDNLFDNIKKGTPPIYLNDEYCGKNSGMFNNYIWTDNNGEITYYTIAGEKIISSSANNYSYIQQYHHLFNGKIDKEILACEFQKENIIVVGRPNRNLDTLYGYYDLDKKEEIFPPTAFKALEWLGCCGVVFMPEVFLVDRTGKKYLNNYNFNSKVYKPYNSFPVDIDENEGKFFTDIIFHQKKDSTTYFVANSVKELTNSIYLVAYEKYVDCRYRNIEYTLVKDIFGKPERISGYYPDIIIAPAENLFCLVKEDGRWKRLIVDVYENTKQNDVDKVILPKLSGLATSYLVSDQVKENIPKIIKKDCDTDQFKLIASNKQELSNIDYSNTNLDSKYLGEEKVASNIIEILKYTPQGVMLVRTDCVDEPDYLVNDNGIMFYKKGTVKFMDNLGNICISVPYNTSKRDVLVNSNGDILILYALNIAPPVNNVYIVTVNEGDSLYDAYGNRISQQHEKLDWIQKYYINVDGKLINSEYKLVVSDNGYIHIIDDNEKICIQENIEYEETIKKLVLLRRELLDDSL